MAMRIRYGTAPEWTIDLGQLENGDRTTFGELFDVYCELKHYAQPERVNVKLTCEGETEARTVELDSPIPNDAAIVEFQAVAEKKG